MFNKNLIDFKHFLEKLQVRIDALVHDLLFNIIVKIRNIISSILNMIVIKSLVLISSIKSKYSHDLTDSVASTCCSISFIISRNIKSENKSLISSPSIERILRICGGES